MDIPVQKIFDNSPTRLKTLLKAITTFRTDGVPEKYQNKNKVITSNNHFVNLSDNIASLNL